MAVRKAKKKFKLNGATVFWTKSVGSGKKEKVTLGVNFDEVPAAAKKLFPTKSKEAKLLKAALDNRSDEFGRSLFASGFASKEGLSELGRGDKVDLELAVVISEGSEKYPPRAFLNIEEVTLLGDAESEEDEEEDEDEEEESSW